MFIVHFFRQERGEGAGIKKLLTIVVVLMYDP